MRSRPYVRVASNLSLTTSELSASVPKFNPAQLMMDDGRGNAVPSDETPGAEPDAEVSFVTRDLASVLPRVKIAAVAPLEDVIARVRDAAEWSGSVQSSDHRKPHAHAAGRRTTPELRAGRHRGRPLRGVRGAYRAGKHHDAAEERQE